MSKLDFSCRDNAKHIFIHFASASFILSYQSSYSDLVFLATFVVNIMYFIQINVYLLLFESHFSVGFFFVFLRHYPKQGFTSVADTPENLRLKQQSKIQSQVG